MKYIFAILMSLMVFSVLSPHSSPTDRGVIEIGLSGGKVSIVDSILIPQAMASEAPPALQLPADQDPALLILNLITNWKTMGSYALVSALAMLAGLLVRSYVQDKWKYKRLLMAGISLVFAFAKQMVEGNASIPAILVTTLVTYGAAKYIYDELRDAGVITKPAV